MFFKCPVITPTSWWVGGDINIFIHIIFFRKQEGHLTGCPQASNSMYWKDPSSKHKHNNISFHFFAQLLEEPVTLLFPQFIEKNYKQLQKDILRTNLSKGQFYTYNYMGEYCLKRMLKLLSKNNQGVKPCMLL